MPPSPAYRPSPRILALGSAFYDEVLPARFPDLRLRFRNQRAAERVGLGDLDATEWEAAFARFEPLPRNLERPLALRYHGHQFDVYNARLGDGRGFLYAQLEDDVGRLLDLGTKGSGTTPWSRGGDGRLTLKGGVREVLATEMLEALGVSTSRSFSLFETGERLERGDEPSPTRASVLVRLSHSHLRVGTFQRVAAMGDVGAMDRLLTHVLEAYTPSIASHRDRVPRFMDAITRSIAKLCASMMVAGFVHGVLNSDNMSITGESFDYGPYRFLPTYDPGFTAAYFDHSGLYAFGRQPGAMMRNVLRLGEALRLLEPALDPRTFASRFEATFDDELTAATLRRLGLVPRGDPDEVLVTAVFELLHTTQAGYDRVFFDLRGGLRPTLVAGPYDGSAWERLRGILGAYSPLEGARAHAYFEDPAPCALLIDEVESIWSAIAERDDWAPFEAKVASIRRMGEAMQRAASPPRSGHASAPGG